MPFSFFLIFTYFQIILGSSRFFFFLFNGESEEETLIISYPHNCILSTVTGSPKQVIHMYLELYS